MLTDVEIRDLRPIFPFMRLSIVGLEFVLYDVAEDDDFCGDARFGDDARRFFREEGIEAELERATFSLLLAPEAEGSKFLLVQMEREEKPVEIEVWLIPGKLLALRKEVRPLQLTSRVYSKVETELCDGPNVQFALLVDGLYVDLSEQTRLHQATFDNSRYVRGNEVTFW